MKQLFTVCLLTIMSATSFGQTILNGFVKEYNERLAKTPLGSVEIVISNASTTTSDNQGNFRLEFRTLKPGDRVNVRRIEKLGYEIFNKEAIEQWYIARDGKPFTIVMCKSSKFKRIRDNYSRISSASYDRQYKREKAALEEMKRSGRLREDEYKVKLAKLSEEYDNKLESLDNYVDHFARIDLGELSALEAEIIELVQRGEIDQAIQLYEKENLEEKFISQVDMIRKITAADETLKRAKESYHDAQDSIFAAVIRKNELLALKGGRESFETIGKNLKTIADADTSFFRGLKTYADYLYNQHRYEESYAYFLKCVNIPIDVVYRLELLLCLQKSSYMSGVSMEKSTNYGNKRLRLIKETFSLDSKEYAVKCAETYRFLGFVQRAEKHYDNAKGYFLKARDLLLPLKTELSDDEIVILARIIANAGSIDIIEKRYKDAERYCLEARQLLQTYWEKHPKGQGFYKAENSLSLARVYFGLKEFDKSVEYLEECRTIYDKLAERNPMVYTNNQITILRMLGDIQERKGEKDKADSYYSQAYTLASNASLLDGNNYDKDKAYLLQRFALRSAQKGKLEIALEQIEESLKYKRSIRSLELKGMILVDLRRVEEARLIWYTHLKDHYAGKERSSKLYRKLNK